MTNQTTIGKLPIGRTIQAALNGIRYNPARALKLAVIPTVAGLLPFIGFIFILVAIAHKLSSPDIPGIAAYIAMSDTAWPWITTIGAAFVTVILLEASYVPMLTAWHRYAILGGEHPESELRFRVGAHEKAYILKLLQVSAIGFIAIGLLFFATMVSLEHLSRTATGAVSGLIMTLAVLALAYVVVVSYLLRLMLVLPAASVGMPMSFRESWDATRGNTIRLFFTVFIVSLIAGIISNVLSWIAEFIAEQLPASFSMAGYFAELLIYAMTNALMLCVMASIFSAAYQHFVENKLIFVARGR